MRHKTSKNEAWMQILIAWIWCISLLTCSCRNQTRVPLPSTTNLSRNIQVAFDKARAAVIENLESPIEWGRLGKLCMAHEFLQDAVECFETASNLDPRDARWKYFQAVVLQEFDLEKSARCYSEALAAKPDNIVARYRWAQVLARLGRYDDARAELAKADIASPNQPAVELALARLAIAQSNWTEAAERLQSAVKLAPHTREIYNELSRVAAHEKRWSDAYEFQRAGNLAAGTEVSLDDPWLQEITELELNGHPASDKADRLLAQGQLHAAVAILRNVARDHPELPRARLNLAVALWQIGQTDESQREFKQLVSQFPDEATTYLTWGRLLATSGRFQEAKLRFEQAIERKADSGEGFAMLGAVLEKQDRLEDAVVLYKRSIQTTPQIISTYLSLASVFCRLGDPSAAELVLESATKLNIRSEAEKTELGRLSRVAAALKTGSKVLNPEPESNLKSQ